MRDRRIGDRPTGVLARTSQRLAIAAVSSCLLLLGLVAPAGATLTHAPQPTTGVRSNSSATRLVTFGPVPSKGLGRKLGPASSRHQLVVLVLHKTASASQWATVRSWLAADGVTPTRVGNALKVVASTDELGRLFHTSFARYEDPSAGHSSTASSSVVAATSRPVVPDNVVAALAEVLGLSNAPVASGSLLVVPGSQHPWTPPATGAAHPDTTTVTPTACSAATADASSVPGAMTEVQVGDHYGVNQLQAAGYEGAGVTIAVVEFADVNMTDVQAYDTCFGLSSSNVSVVNVDGGGTSSDVGEADADVEQLQTQAPLAHIEVFQGPNNLAGIYLTYQAIAQASPMPQIVSSSWGACTAGFDGSTGQNSDQIPGMTALFAQMATAGQSIFVSAGDLGSEDCAYATYDPTTGTYVWSNATTLGTQYPAVDPNVTSVGGTVPQSGGPDVVWNACSTGPDTCYQGTTPLTGPGDVGGAGGGGVTSQFPEPSWQDSAGTFTGRAFPDVSADANGQVSYVSGDWQVGAGTSLSAPLLAGMFADVLPTYATGPNGLSGGLGNVAPGFYKDVAANGFGSAVTAVTSGNNDFTDAFNHTKYVASSTPGYSMAAGLGTPIAMGLVGPQPTGLSSSTANAGASITISGSYLSNTTVAFGTSPSSMTPATITASSPSSLTVTVPPGSGNTDVVVSNPWGSAAPIPFLYSAPSFTSAASATATVGSPFSFTVTTTGSTTSTLTEAGTLPSGVTFVDNGNGTATLSGTPEAKTGGVYDLTLGATNTAGTTTQSFVLTVDEAPYFTSPAALTVSVGSTLAFAPAATGTPAPTFSEGGNVLPAGLSWTGTELSGSVTSSDVGTYPLIFTATNSQGSATQDFTLTIDEGPVFSAPSGCSSFSVGQDNNSCDFTATGSPAPTYSETGPIPAGLTFYPGGGGLLGTPATGSAGVYPITVTATNSAGTSDEQFTIIVDGPPSFTSATTATFGVGRPGSFSVVASGYPEPTYSETGTLPSGVTLSADGTLAGTPVSGSSGTYPIVITATNSVSTVTQSFTLVVGTPPSFASTATATLTEGQAGTLDLAGAGTPMPTYSIVSGSLPTGMTLDSSGTITGTPEASGTFTVLVQASNAAGSLKEDVTVTVNAAQSTPTGGGGGGGGGGGIPTGGGGGGGGGIPTTEPTTPVVTPTPTPTPVPSPTPQPSPTPSPAPVVTSTVKATTVLHDGATFTTTCTTSLCQGRITLYLGTTAVSGAKAYKVPAGKTATFVVPLDKVGLAALAKSKNHVLWVREVVTVAGGRTMVRGIRLSLAPVVAVPKAAAAKVTFGTIPQTVSCSDAICRGTVMLYLGKLAVSVAKVYATGAGHTETVRVPLTKLGLARLAKAKNHVLWVREVITLKGGATVTRGVRLVA